MTTQAGCELSPSTYLLGFDLAIQGRSELIASCTNLHEKSLGDRAICTTSGRPLGKFVPMCSEHFVHFMSCIPTKPRVRRQATGFRSKLFPHIRKGVEAVSSGILLAAGFTYPALHQFLPTPSRSPCCLPRGVLVTHSHFGSSHSYLVPAIRDWFQPFVVGSSHS